MKDHVADVELSARETGCGTRPAEIGTVEVLPAERPRVPRGPAPTPRRIIAGRMLLSGAEQSTGAALRAAGYKASTARTPRANGLAPERLMEEAALHPEGEGLHALRPLATERLRQILTDAGASDAAAVGAALGVHRVASEIGETDPGISAADQMRFKRWLRRGLARAYRLGAVRGLAEGGEP